MTQTANPSVAVPEWDKIARDITCPLCEYNLRGLAEARCPECGSQFTWRDLLDDHRQPHPYLFEHHPARNIWSFWKTAVGGLRPERFWKTLTPLQPSRPQRLLLYWFIALAAGLLAPAMLAIQSNVDRTFGSPSARILGRRFGGTQIVDVLHPGFGSFWLLRFNTEQLMVAIAGVRFYLTPTKGEVLGAGVIVAWPIATILALMIFQASLRRAKIKPIHVMRCVIYSSDGTIWLGIGAVLMMAIYCALAASGAKAYWFSPIFIEMTLLTMWVVFFAWRLKAAIRLYMQMDRPGAVVLATQIILVLALLCICLN